MRQDMHRIIFVCTMLAAFALGQTVAGKPGFAIQGGEISSTNEATKGENPRKVLFRCSYDAGMDKVSNCSLAAGATLTELIGEFVQRDTKRMKEIDLAASSCKK
jgi:hypothetical protein